MGTTKGKKATSLSSTSNAKFKIRNSASRRRDSSSSVTWASTKTSTASTNIISISNNANNMNKKYPKGNDLMNQLLDELLITEIICFNERSKESELDDILTEAEDLNIIFEGISADHKQPGNPPNICWGRQNQVAQYNTCKTGM